MKKIFQMLLSATICVAFTSCGNDEPQPPKEPIVGPEQPEQPDKPEEPADDNYTIYATGYSDVVQYGYWWKTGDSKLMTLSKPEESVTSNAIAVTDDGTVYIGGSLTSDALDGYEAAALWKDGEATMLTDMSRPTDAAVYGLAADGKDIWAAGFYRYLRDGEWSFQRDAAVIWKNGDMISLTKGESYAKAWGVSISGNNVYVAGEKSNADGFAVATVWKGNKDMTDWSNCEVISLSDGLTHAYAESIHVDGNDVYAAGYKSTGGNSKIAVMWKNGVETKLSSNESYAVSVSVSDGKVYVAGWEYVEVNGKDCAVATLWEDGVAQHLYDQPHSSQARCVVTKGKNIFVSGFIGDQAVIWINGKAGALTDGTYPTCITSLFVK